MKAISKSSSFLCFISLGNLAAQTPPPLPPPTTVFLGCTSGPASGKPMADSGVGFGGEVFKFQDGTLWTWPLGQRPSLKSANRRVIPGADSKRSGFSSPALYRAGTFWKQTDHDIQRWESRVSLWVQVLDTRDRSFAAFEITYDGRLVLIGSPDHFLEIFEPGTTSPSLSVPYPELGVRAGVAARSRYLWEDFTTAAYQECLVIYPFATGQTFLFNAAKNALKAVDMPWKPLDFRKELPRIETEGTLVLAGFPGPGCIQFFPGMHNELLVGYRTRDLIGPGGLERTAEGHVAFRGKTQLSPLRVAAVDLETGHGVLLEDHVEGDLPLWQDAQARLRPLSEVLPEEPPQADPKSGKEAAKPTSTKP